MRSIFFNCALAASTVSAIELEKSANQLVTELGLANFDASAYHQYDNFTGEDFEIDYEELLKEYYEGQTIGSASNPRGQSNRLRANTGSPQVQERTSVQDKEFIQRFIQLKYSILFLQKTKKFGRYCFYGCWCLPNGASDLGVGTGPPIDDIDRSCREFATCYNCLYNQEIGAGCDEAGKGRYTIKGRQDGATGQKYLMCMDPPGTCKRNRCECDRGLAEKLGEYEGQWNLQNHRRWGSPPFDADQYCRVQVPEPVQHSAISDGAVFEESMDGSAILGGNAGRMEASLGGNSGGGNGDSNQVKLPVSINPVVASAPIYGEIVGCCGRAPNLHYFREGQKCCTDGEIVDANAPCGIEFL